MTSIHKSGLNFKIPVPKITIYFNAHLQAQIRNGMYIMASLSAGVICALMIGIVTI